MPEFDGPMPGGLHELPHRTLLSEGPHDTFAHAAAMYRMPLDPEMPAMAEEPFIEERRGHHQRRPEPPHMMGEQRPMMGEQPPGHRMMGEQRPMMGEQAPGHHMMGEQRPMMGEQPPGHRMMGEQRPMMGEQAPGHHMMGEQRPMPRAEKARRVPLKPQNGQHSDFDKECADFFAASDGMKQSKRVPKHLFPTEENAPFPQAGLRLPDTHPTERLGRVHDLAWMMRQGLHEPSMVTALEEDKLFMKMEQRVHRPQFEPHCMGMPTMPEYIGNRGPGMGPHIVPW